MLQTSGEGKTCTTYQQMEVDPPLVGRLPFAEYVLLLSLVGFTGNRFHYLKYCIVFFRRLKQMEEDGVPFGKAKSALRSWEGELFLVGSGPSMVLVLNGGTLLGKGKL